MKQEGIQRESAFLQFLCYLKRLELDTRKEIQEQQKEEIKIKIKAKAASAYERLGLSPSLARSANYHQ